MTFGTRWRADDRCQHDQRQYGRSSRALAGCTISGATNYRDQQQIRGNTGGAGFSGGFSNAAGSGQTALLKLINCTVTGNAGEVRSDSGGGISAMSVAIGGHAPGAWRQGTLVAGNQEDRELV
ncbi:MAG: hypothetical protein IPJ07_00220 [Acidobacteria bacterium]|nr:hypothetical protein [Acidobacteriota bacterium]